MLWYNNPEAVADMQRTTIEERSHGRSRHRNGRSLWLVGSGGPDERH
jgi:hypothetical protein